MNYEQIISFIRHQFNTDAFIPLHAPSFIGNEKKYVLETIDSTFVSSVGKFVDIFETRIKEYTGAKYAIATVNGTAALHMSLILAGVSAGDLVLTQALSFIATSNVITYVNASPIFIDVDRDSMGLCPKALKEYLSLNSFQRNGACYHNITNQKISACIPMHTFGHPAKIDEILAVCSEFNIILIEDAAESIGTYYKGIHTGNFGKVSAFSFNGNKTITCGGGGVIITNDEQLAKLGKHLTTQAKIPHSWEFVHDFVGYNYRLPNLNAAMACAQIEQIEKFINDKRTLAAAYKNFFAGSQFDFFFEPTGARSNYWLNAIFTENLHSRNEMLEILNRAQIMARPCWQLIHRLQMFDNCLRGPLTNSEWIAERLVNIPSSYRKPN